MSKQVVIYPCYNQPAVVIHKGMSTKQLYEALRGLQGQEVDSVHLSNPKKSHS